MFLKMLYATPLYSVLTYTKYPSMLVGMWARSRLSALLIPTFVKKYGINVQEVADPLDSFKTLNDFFIRTLKPGVRPLVAEGIVSPADGRVLAMCDISLTTTFPIKGVSLNLEKLLQSSDEAERYVGGSVLIFRLAPGDYHRMHFACDGIPAQPRVITGTYESVDPYVYTIGIQPLEVNERHHIAYTTDDFGTMAIIPVGALFVGSIIYTHASDQGHHRGDEMGYFSFGGSTVVLLFQKNTITVRPDIMAHSAAGIETPINMGQQCAVKAQTIL